PDHALQLREGQGGNGRDVTGASRAIDRTSIRRLGPTAVSRSTRAGIEGYWPAGPELRDPADLPPAKQLALKAPTIHKHLARSERKFVHGICFQDMVDILIV